MTLRGQGLFKLSQPRRRLHRTYVTREQNSLDYWIADNGNGSIDFFGLTMSDYRFRCLGPYEFPVYKSARHWRNHVRVFKPKEARDEVFRQAEADQHRIRTGEVSISGIKEAIGLYVIGMRPRGRLVPFYVGKAARQTLHTRLFQEQDKLAKVHDIINIYKHVKPFVFLFPLVTPSGALAQRVTAEKISSNEKRINSAEYMMIGHAMNANPYLHNVQTVIERQNFSIDGSTGTSANETNFAREYRLMMGFMKPSRAAEKMRKVSEQTEQENDTTLTVMEDALAHPETLELEQDLEAAKTEEE